METRYRFNSADNTYTGEGLHGKALRRFCHWLVLESNDVSCSFMAKQLLLTVNLIEKFSGKLEMSDWQHFEEIFLEKQGYIRRIIEEEEKPRVQQKGVRALALLTECLPKLPTIPQS